MQEVFKRIIDKLIEQKKGNPFIYGKNDKSRDASISRQTLDYAIEIVEQTATECKHGHFGCNSNGQHEKCSKCSDYDCKRRNREWFGAEDDNNGWIPCSERMPEKYGDYLVAWKPLHMSAEDIAKKVGREIPHFYEIVEYDPDDEALWIGSIEQAQREYEIIAWRPLPEPYQPKGEREA